MPMLTNVNAGLARIPVVIDGKLARIIKLAPGAICDVTGAEMDAIKATHADDVKSGALEFERAKRGEAKPEPVKEAANGDGKG